MLKWLVTKAPSSSNSLEKVVTDDPLATLSRRGYKHEPIYAVSRVNPIFEEEDSKDAPPDVPEQTTPASKSEDVQEELPDSPPTDRESVRSSGYGSKEADSVSFKSDSQEDDELLGGGGGVGVGGGVAQNGKDLPMPGITNYDDTKEEEPIPFDSPGTVADIRRSFEHLSSSQTSDPTAIPNETIIRTNEIEIVVQNPNFVKSIEVGCNNKLSHLEVIPEVSHESDAETSPSKKVSWPRVSHLAQALQKQADRIHQRRERERLKKHQYENSDNNRAHVLRFNPLVSVVAQNERYVTGISVSSNTKAQNESKQQHNLRLNTTLLEENRYPNQFNLKDQHTHLPSYFRANNSYLEHEYPLVSLQPDSLITEDTLQMMNYPGYDSNSVRKADVDMEYLDANRVPPHDMPNFGRAVYSGFYSSIPSGSSARQDSLSRKDHTGSINSKRKGVSVVKDLWEKTGLKTNGRKLLVDVNELLNEEQPQTNHSRKSSYGSTEYYRSLNSISEDTNNSTAQSRRKTEVIRTISGRSEDNYDRISSRPRSSSISHSYEDIPEFGTGIDNLGFLYDRGQSRTSATSSLQSKSGHHHPQFQHNLTEFQRRVSERLQGEPNHRKSILGLDVNDGNDTQPNTIEDTEKGMASRAGKGTHNGSKKSRNFPGKAIRELGLSGDWRGHTSSDYSTRTNSSPWSLSHSSNTGTQATPGSYGNRNRIHIWDQFYGRYKDESLPGYFFPHPNGEAPINSGVAGGGFSQDFTLDARRSQRNLRRRSASQRRRRCCAVAVVVGALVIFVGAIVGLSLYSTGGQRIFGSM